MGDVGDRSDHEREAANPYLLRLHSLVVPRFHHDLSEVQERDGPADSATQGPETRKQGNIPGSSTNFTLEAGPPSDGPPGAEWLADQNAYPSGGPSGPNCQENKVRTPRAAPQGPKAREDSEECRR